MINYIPNRKCLVILAEQEPHDLRVELAQHDVTELAIHGNPAHFEALSDYPAIEKLNLNRCKIDDLGALQGLHRLRRLDIGFGTLANVDLRFCSATLEILALARLKRLRDLSQLPPMPKLEVLVLNHLHSLQPPDFRGFPRLRHLSIWKTEWPSLQWLSHLPTLEELHISQITVADGDWRPILELPKLRYLHGMKDVFKSAACQEFQRLRPQVVVDKGIPVDMQKHPELEEFLEGK